MKVIFQFYCLSILVVRCKISMWFGDKTRMCIRMYGFWLKMTNVNRADDDTCLSIQNISWPHIAMYMNIQDIKCSKSFLRKTISLDIWRIYGCERTGINYFFFKAETWPKINDKAFGQRK